MLVCRLSVYSSVQNSATIAGDIITGQALEYAVYPRTQEYVTVIRSNS